VLPAAETAGEVLEALVMLDPVAAKEVPPATVVADDDVAADEAGLAVAADSEDAGAAPDADGVAVDWFWMTHAENRTAVVAELTAATSAVRRSDRIAKRINGRRA
jgi:hypothetical protein